MCIPACALGEFVKLVYTKDRSKLTHISFKGVMSGTPKILVVEDNGFVRMQIVRFLNEEGYETVECEDGEAALEAINDNVALAIVDIRMEPIDGFEFLRRIRIDDNKTPVVLITGDKDPEILSESQRWDVAAVLMKPVQRDRLVKMVSRLLRAGS